MSIDSLETGNQQINTKMLKSSHASIAVSLYLNVNLLKSLSLGITDKKTGHIIVSRREQQKCAAGLGPLLQHSQRQFLST